MSICWKWYYISGIPIGIHVKILARSPRRSTGDKSGLCIWNLCLFVCVFVCLIVLGKFSNYSPHPPLFPLFIVLSPLLFISKIFSVMIKNETSWEWIPMYGPLGGRWTVRVGGGMAALFDAKYLKHIEAVLLIRNI